MKTAEEKRALVDEAMPRVERIVSAMTKRFAPHVDRDEIRSFALNGLAMAIERFDASRNVPIQTFAAKRVEGQILDGIAKNHHLPRRLLREVAVVKKSREILSLEQQTPPPQDKVEAVHRLADRLKELACVYVTSCSTEAEQQIESVAFQDSESNAQRQEYYRVVRGAIGELPDRQREIIHQYFYQDRTLSQIALDFDKSRSWACRNLQAALANLREYF
ncbi:MAG: sigma-70 family RNA polymerase sigma factor [Deltaproteobacteria bacterium]|nr:sigma-70 family RNA polymerase sigma factor [Deltaproteobacteria bacterium]